MAVKTRLDIKKIFLLLLLIIVLGILGVAIIEFAGNATGISIPIPGLKILRRNNLKNLIKKSESKYLLEREELEKKEEKLKIKEEYILNRENEVKAKEGEVDKKLEALTEREEDLEKKVVLLETREKEYQDVQKNIREQAEKLYNMPPADAVALLSKQKEADIVDILRAIDKYSEEIGSASTAPYMLKLLGDSDKDKAANVLRKLKFVSDEYVSGVETLDESEFEEPPLP